MTTTFRKSVSRPWLETSAIKGPQKNTFPNLKMEIEQISENQWFKKCSENGKKFRNNAFKPCVISSLEYFELHSRLYLTVSRF
jgi:hypothetical protein